MVTGSDAVTDRIRRLQRSARQEVRWIDKPPYLGPAGVTSQVECDQLDRGVQYRVVYDSSALGHHELRGDIEATIRRGEQARLLPNAPVKVALIDDRFACLPLAPDLTTAPASMSIDDRRLIALLTAGVPDSKAAKQLGVSPRTYQRRVQALMGRLGVETRFQAGLQAALLGWTTES